MVSAVTSIFCFLGFFSFIGLFGAAKSQAAELRSRIVVSKKLQNWGLAATETIRARQVDRSAKLVTVAVIDTGADIDHRDLRDRIWTNPGESGTDDLGHDKSTNGLDDDHNGYVDDVHGWNFVDHSPEVRDEHGHGTHIAGIIAGERSGVAPNARLMVLKYYSDRSSPASNLDQTIQAIEYAVANGAEIINYSSGGPESSAREESAIRRAQEKGILFVSAAGNEASNSDLAPFFPAGYGLKNVISVAATSESGRLLAASNHGIKSVDLAAPGERIYSSLPDEAFGLMSGTSQATAFVTGAAALILGEGRFVAAPELLKRHLVRTGTFDRRLVGQVRSAARLNSFQAVAKATEPKR